MAALRPFRGLRYADAAGPLASLISPPVEGLDGTQREAYAARHAHNAVALAQPEGHADDRSKFIRYARAAARLAEWRREGILVAEAAPAFYRLTQRVGEQAARTVLLAVAALDDLSSAETPDVRGREDRLRLMEATRTVFAPALAYYEDPQGAALAAIRAAPASSEVSEDVEAFGGRLERIDDPEAVEVLAEAFRGKRLLVADGVDAVEAARAFPGATGAFVALASLDDPAYARLAVHRVVRRIPGSPTPDALLAQLSTRFVAEPHHNRNLILLMDRETTPTFGLATPTGHGYLLRPIAPVEGSGALWLQREILSGLLGISDSENSALYTDPIQATRAVEEGAAAAFLLPRPGRHELQEGTLLPHRSSIAYPPIPTGFVFWSIGDDV